MKEIKLTQGKSVLVDDWNFDWLNQWKWFAHKQKGGNYYAKRNITVDRKQKTILMHRLIMKTPDNLEVDHSDTNGLNCTEINMRNCLHKENIRNVKPRGVSKYKGVYFVGMRVRSCIQVNGKRIHIGYFKTETDAAKAYDQKAIELHGEFANLNFKYD